MAIFSLNHSTVGRTTHAPRTASANARYITREEACTQVLGSRMPTERDELYAWLVGQEDKDRKNARVIDKVMVALPRELTHAQNAELVTEFAEGLTKGRASWVAGIHDGIGDADNPHAHIILRDRDFETGKRVMELSEKGSTERIRIAWEERVNTALVRAGFEVRVDRRTLEAQGLKREAEIHVGQAARQLTERGERPDSTPREVGRIVDGGLKPIVIDYPSIDGGKTRHEANDEIKERNRYRALGSEQPELDWTDRAGLVAQERAANEWVRKAQEQQASTSMRDRQIGGAPNRWRREMSDDASKLRAEMDREQKSGPELER
ncbi:MAG: MobA/MobL family protein [Afipia sp.]|nr:MobA/MobL family protein [Afipia sp.]